TMAFLSGKLYKRYHTYPTALSPNKTTAGFIVGFIFSPIGFLIGYYMFPELFPGGVPVVLILGLMVGFTTISGDLIESGLKRSARRKDSGEVILGRGGMLDSLDSILYSAPIVFYVYQLTNGIWVI
ncbi:MAG: phosphatidate cytidylyltransferase, partial [Salinispira sp.]